MPRPFKLAPEGAARPVPNDFPLSARSYVAQTADRPINPTGVDEQSCNGASCSRQETKVPLQNRVAPDGAVIATPHRGLMMGNRGGAFHLPDRTLGRRRWATRQW